MTPDELPRKEAAKWLRQAAKDRNAAQVLMGPEPSPRKRPRKAYSIKTRSSLSFRSCQSGISRASSR